VLTGDLRDLIYAPYLTRLVATQRRLEREHGVMRRIGFDRLQAGATWRERWARFRARWLVPRVRRWRGELVQVIEDVRME
jgi:hypothetical protein